MTWSCPADSDDVFFERFRKNEQEAKRASGRTRKLEVSLNEGEDEEEGDRQDTVSKE